MAGVTIEAEFLSITRWRPDILETLIECQITTLVVYQIIGGDEILFKHL